MTVKLLERVLLRAEDVLAHPEGGGGGVIGEDGVRHAPMVTPSPGQVVEVALVAVEPEKAVSAVGCRDDLFREPVAGCLEQLAVKEEVVRKEDAADMYRVLEESPEIAAERG